MFAGMVKYSGRKPAAIRKAVAALDSEFWDQLAKLDALNSQYNRQWRKVTR